MSPLYNPASAPAAGGLGYVIQLEGTESSPTDATSYYMGFGHYNGDETDTMVTGGGTTRPIIIPKTGTVNAITGVYRTGGDASTENSTIYFRLNDSTDTAITTTFQAINLTEIVNTSLSIAVTQGEDFNIKWVTPTWVTNPTGTSHFRWWVYIS